MGMVEPCRALILEISQRALVELSLGAFFERVELAFRMNLGWGLVLRAKNKGRENAGGWRSALLAPHPTMFG